MFSTKHLCLFNSNLLLVLLHIIKNVISSMQKNGDIDISNEKYCSILRNSKITEKTKCIFI